MVQHSFDTTKQLLDARQRQLISEGFRIVSITKGRGNNYTIWAQCVGL